MTISDEFTRNDARRTKWLNRVAKRSPEARRIIIAELGLGALRAHPLPEVSLGTKKEVPEADGEE